MQTVWSVSLCLCKDCKNKDACEHLTVLVHICEVMDAAEFDIIRHASGILAIRRRGAS